MNKEIKLKMPKCVVVSDDIYDDSKEKLKNLGVEIYPSFKNENVSAPLRCHVDMQLVSIGNNSFVCAPECYEYYREILRKHNINLIKGFAELSSNYPGDIAYNITVTEKCVVHNFKYTDSVIKAKISDRTQINVSQGYCGCSICVVNSDSFITSDNGLYLALSKAGYNVLKISVGGIILPGYNYGFIGGSSFLLNNNTLAINGNITQHPDYEKIKMFCSSLNVELLSLSSQKIMDIGSAVTIY